MAKPSLIVSAACLVAFGAFSVLPSCTVSDDSDDDDGGSGGENGSTGGTGGTSGGTSGSGGAVDGGAAGETSGGVDAGGASGAGGAAGSAGAAGDAGAGGEAGAFTGNTCDAPATGEGVALGKTCASYCADFFATCSDYSEAQDEPTFAGLAECLGFCENFGDEQLCCRAYHVYAAETDAVTHCPHAAGDALCN